MSGSVAFPRGPVELLDPDGEGIYLYAEDEDNLLLEAAWRLHGDRRAWPEVETQLVWMEPSETGDEWVPAKIGRWPRGWRLNLPLRWRPVAYLYCTPRVAA